MNLYIMGHADATKNAIKKEVFEAEETTPISNIEQTTASTIAAEEDFHRPLTRRGRKKTAQIIHRLDKLGITFDFIVFSPYKYARQTAEIVADVLDLRKANLVKSKNRVPDGVVADLINELKTFQHIEKHTDGRA